MAYRQIEDLPRAIRGHLPPPAQEVYRAAFNNAWDQHADERGGEAAVHRIAWSAVKRRYRKAGKDWLPVER